jgi:two-component system response regulator YesN
LTVFSKIHHRIKHSVYAIFLLSYISILLLTLSSSFVYYAQINKQITAQTEISRQLLLTQLQTTVESSLSDIERLCNEIAFDKSIYQYAKGLPSFSAKDIEARLSSKLYRGNVFFDYFIYIKASDEIVTPTIKMNSKDFFNIIYTFQDLDYEYFRNEYLDGVHFQKYMPIENITQFDDGTVQILPFIQTFPVGSSQEPLGQVICFINAGELFSNVNLIHQSTGSDVYVLNENNEIIITSQDASYLNTGLIDTITSGKVTRDAVISKRTADSIGWKFIIQTPKHLSLSENRHFLLTALTIFMVYLVAGLILVHFLTVKNYHPIFEINTLIHTNAGDNLPPKDTTNEFDTIKGTILHQLEKDKKLTGIINSQIPDVRRALFDRMLKGLVTDYNQLYEQLKALNIIFPHDPILLISLELDETSPFLQSDGTFDENLFLFRLIASNVGNELFEEHFLSYYHDCEQQQCVFLLNPSCSMSREEMSRLAVEKAEILLKYIQDTFQLYCYIGISKVYTSLHSIPLCYDEARKASEYGRLIQSPVPVAFDNMQNLENNYYYPAEIEYQLISSIKSGQFDQAKALIDNIFNLNTLNKSLSAQALKALLFEIGTTLQKQVNSICIAKGEAPVTNYLYNELLDAPSIESARVQYFDIIDQISYQRLKDKSNNKTERLASAIAEYISKHVHNQWIDLNTLSEEFHITPQYISNIFKRYQNENIKDFISKAKLENAKELLLTTDLSVNDIAQRLGYAGEIGIIRLFKKYEKMTPGDFRNLNH